MQRVVLVTGHYLQSKRRAGFHWLAEAYWRQGWEVVFLTIGLSWLSRLKCDHRFDYSIVREAGVSVPVRERLTSYVWFTPWHPTNLHSSVLNWLANGLFLKYGSLPLGKAEDYLRSASMLVFESGQGLLLFDRCRRMNPNARYVYRVSDDMRLAGQHPVVLSTEGRVASLFDVVSVPCQAIYQRFAQLPNAALHYHGVQRDLFDRPCANPYPENTFNLVFVGTCDFDQDFLRIASALFPKWNFHVIGPIQDLPQGSNIVAHGELSFAQTVPFIKHAQVGLQTLTHTARAATLSDSLKVLQYTYCRLPIVAAGFIPHSRANAFPYRSGDAESIRVALVRASQWDRSRPVGEDIHSWDELASILAGGNT